jgi:DNA-binding transcriptional LysR family regulator
VRIELHLDDSVSDLVAQGYDVGIRVGQLKSSNLVARAIAPLPFVECASPTYFRQHSYPKTLADLSEHNCLRLSRQKGLWPILHESYRWPYFAVQA